jgi:hypothetical protein
MPHGVVGNGGALIMVFYCVYVADLEGGGGQ